MKFRIYIIIQIVFFGFLSHSCKRDDDEDLDKNRFAIDKSKIYIDDDYENRLKDSVWYYYKIVSLWETSLSPSISQIDKMDSLNYLKNNFTQYFQTAGDVLGYLMYQTKASVVGNSLQSNVGSGNNFSFYRDILFSHKDGESKAYDWYSYLDRGGFITGAIQNGYITGFGMDLTYIQQGISDENPTLFVRFVEKNSSAYLAGLRRGDQIISLNGDTKIDYNTQKNKNFSSLSNYLNAPNLTVVYKNEKGSHSTLLQYSANWYADPLFIDTVLTAGDKRIGYLGLSTFISTNAFVSDRGVVKSFQSRLTEAFDKLVAGNVSECVVDLRYNGGGSVYTAEYLANLLSPTSASGKLMYTSKINQILKNMGWDEPGEDFAPVYFSKMGSLNLSKVYFLVSEETASASELLINVLSPYMRVYLIGNYKYDGNQTIATRTYGKPVGSFPIELVSSNNELYAISFQMFNKDGFGDYFDGLKPNTHVWEFKSFLDFGNQQESLLASALAHIKTGSFETTYSRSVLPSTPIERNFSIRGVSERKIRGMYKFPHKKIRF